MIYLLAGCSVSWIKLHSFETNDTYSRISDRATLTTSLPLSLSTSLPLSLNISPSQHISLFPSVVLSLTLSLYLSLNLSLSLSSHHFTLFPSFSISHTLLSLSLPSLSFHPPLSLLWSKWSCVSWCVYPCLSDNYGDVGNDACVIRQEWSNRPCPFQEVEYHMCCHAARPDTSDSMGTGGILTEAAHLDGRL